MRPFALSVVVIGLALTGCNRGPTVVVVPPAASPPALPIAQAPPPVVTPPFPALDLSPQERYDAAVWSAITLLTDRKYAEALSSLEQAQRIRDTEQVRQEIARVKLCLDAARAKTDLEARIKAVLTDGQADDAARLAGAALREYGDSDAADALARLKRQSDALATFALDNPTRIARFRLEADEAVRANNLRAAALAFEQCLAAGDAAVRPRLAELRARLTRYDDARRRADELRRASGELDEALAALKSAAAVWDTPQIRQDIDECTFAMQARRERLSVAEFDTRSDVGTPRFGQTIAEELLPAFKARFDLVDGGQVAKICDDLRLHGADVIDQETGRRELARLTRVRYLVVGSVTRLGGIVVHARLVDLQTGLVVQTGKVAAATTSEVTALLPQLAVMLQMDDEQRVAYEQQLARQAGAIPVAAELVNVPSPPPPGASGANLALVFSTARPPDFGGIAIEDFRQLPPPAAPGGNAAIGVQMTITKDHKVRARALSVAVELGDDLFRRGRYQEAHAQFQLALDLAPGQKEIQVRLDQCKPHLPLVASPLVVAPRLAVLDFVTAGDTGLVPPGFGAWASENVAPYMSPPYDLADRGQVYWYMGRLGMTLRDAVVDPLARLYLGRALNVRFVVLGTVQATPAGLEVVAHLLDTETGAEVNTAAAVARDRGELKCRLGEIARWLLLDPAERLRREAEAAQAQALLVQAEAAAKQSNYSLAIELTKKAGRKTPGIRVEVLLNQFDRQGQYEALEAQRRTAWEQQQALAAAATRRQQELAAEAAGIAAAQQAAIDAPERQRRRELACQQLLAQARAARDAQNFAVSLQLYESALAIERNSDAIREHERVQAQVKDRARAEAAVDTMRREAALRQERAADAGRMRAQLDAERQQRAAAEQARRQAQDRSDAREYTRLLDEAQRFQAKGDFDSAVGALQTAKRLRPNSEVERLLTAALVDQSRASPQRVGDQTRRDLEAKLATESAARAQADADARRQAELRAKSDAEAKARADAEAKRIAEAKAKADLDARVKAEAESKLRSDAEAKRQADANAKVDAETRIKVDADAKVRAATEQAAHDAEARRRQQEEEQQRRDAYTRSMTQGRAAVTGRRFDEAQKAFADALKAMPNDLEANRALKQAEDAARPPAPVPPPPPPPKTTATPLPPPPKQTTPVPPPPPTFAQQMQAGAAFEKQEKFADALRAYQAALAIVSTDPAAIKRADFARHMDAGVTALKAAKKPDAIREFEAALKSAPNDPAATKWLQQARR